MTATLILSLDKPEDVDAYVHIAKRLGRNGLEIHGKHFDLDEQSMMSGTIERPPTATIRLREAE